MAGRWGVRRWPASVPHDVRRRLRDGSKPGEVSRHVASALRKRARAALASAVVLGAGFAALSVLVATYEPEQPTVNVVAHVVGSDTEDVVFQRDGFAFLVDRDVHARAGERLADLERRVGHHIEGVPEPMNPGDRRFWAAVAALAGAAAVLWCVRRARRFTAAAGAVRADADRPERVEHGTYLGSYTPRPRSGATAPTVLAAVATSAGTRWLGVARGDERLLRRFEWQIARTDRRVEVRSGPNTDVLYGLRAGDVVLTLDVDPDASPAAANLIPLV